MAQLFRVTDYRDSNRTVTFTFLLPPQTATRDTPPEILSREFHYGGHRWRLCLSKKDGQHLSPYLEFCSPSVGLKCILDYTFLLLNRDSYTQNERYEKRKAEFSAEVSRHGARIFISLEDLQKRRGFADSRRDFLLELTLRCSRTVFETRVRLKNVSQNEPDYCRYDSDKFVFGDLEWMIVFCPNMDEEYEPRHLFQLQRISRSESLCKLRHRLVVGVQNKQFQSQILDEIIDFSGLSQGTYMSENYFVYLDRDVLPLRLELMEVINVSLVRLDVQAEVGTTAKKSQGAVCHDKDRQTWLVVPQTSGEYFTLSLHYSDFLNIPPGYLRYVEWKCTLLPSDKFSGKVNAVSAVDSPFHGYYSLQSGQDRGHKMRFPVKMREIRDLQHPWMDVSDGRVTVELCWKASYLLICPIYNAHDDVIRRHNMQMRREIEALQKENNSLEKEVHNYQLSISTRCASGPVSHSGSPQHTGSVYNSQSNSASSLSRSDSRTATIRRSAYSDLPTVQANRNNSVVRGRVAQKWTRIGDERYPENGLTGVALGNRSRSAETPNEWDDLDEYTGPHGRYSLKDRERSDSAGHRIPRNSQYPPSSFNERYHHI